MRVAILGASGFIGRNLMLNLPEDWETHAFFNSSKDFSAWLRKKEIKAKPVRMDLSKIEKKHPDHFDLVISLIANTKKVKPELHPLEHFKADPLALIGFFNNFSCDKFIYFSSGAVYENHTGLVGVERTENFKPTSCYAIAKLSSENLVRYFKKINKIKKFLMVRFFGAYGPYLKSDKLITKMLKLFCFDRGRCASLAGTGKNLIDVMYVQDVVDWIKLVAKQGFQEETVDFGTGDPITIEMLVLKIAQFSQVDKPIINWEGQTPKEDYRFRIGNEQFQFFPPFGYKLKFDWDKGLARFRTWLSENQEER